MLKASKSRQRTLSGQRVALRLFGGELRFGKALVRVLPVLQVPANHRYLLFMQADGTPSGFVATHRPLLIEKGTLIRVRSVTNDNEPREILDRLPLSQVAKDVRAVRD